MIEIIDTDGEHWTIDDDDLEAIADGTIDVGNWTIDDVALTARAALEGIRSPRWETSSVAQDQLWTVLAICSEDIARRIRAAETAGRD